MAANEEEIKLQFLLCGSCEILPASYIKLRSYLNTLASNIADQHNLKILKNLRNRNKTCRYCYSSWSGETTSFKLFPSKKSKFSQVQSNANEEVKKRAVQLNELRNALVLKCKVCSKKTSFSLVKRKPVEAAKKEIVELIKKKNKKDKSCGLALNIKTKGNIIPKNIIHKKKKRINSFAETTSGYSSYNSQINQLKLVKNKLNPLSDNSKNLMLNPYAAQMQRKFSRKKGRKLQSLKKALKDEKNLTRKTLKDFLTVI